MKLKEKTITKDIEDSINIKQQLLKSGPNLIGQIVEEIINAYKKGNKVVWFGNGGSAADAQHLSAELVGKFYDKRDALESIALTTNTSILTAIANDFDFSKVFSRQVKALVKKGDIAIGISTSGTSSNVIRGLEEAKKRGAITVAFTGKLDDEKINKNIDYIIAVPSKDTPRIQESHIMIGHIICHLIEREFFRK
jgi:D-sedoheptulose 7-phosphate isomerase